MRQTAQTLLICVMIGMSTMVFAGPAEDANAAVERWSAAYNSNDTEAVVNTYWPDAMLLLSVNPVVAQGQQAIRTYFSQLTGSGNKNSIGDRRTFALDDRAVVVAGLYEFTRMEEGKPVLAPYSFTMLITRRDNEWRIAHHHSSPRIQLKQ